MAVADRRANRSLETNYLSTDQMSLHSRLDPLLLTELAVVVLAAPALYFPDRFPTWLILASIGLLALNVVYRRYRLGCWFPATPVNWLLWPWFLLLLPLAMWVAPPQLQTEYAIPRALILVWNFSFFWLVVAHCVRSHQTRWLLASLFALGGAAIAIAAIFGTKWGEKFPVLSPVLRYLPSPLIGLFEGAEGGFSPNQIAGTLLFVLPFALAVAMAEFRQRRLWGWLPFALAAGLMTIVLLATQSRSGLFGFVVSIVILVAAPWRWGRRLLALVLILALLALVFLPVSDLLLQLDAGTRFDGVGGGVNISGRYEIWASALAAMQSFPLTGLGLGTFRQLGPLIYPLATIPNSYDIAHAHNFFLQSALDFGIPGLVLIVAVYLLAGWQGMALWRAAPFPGSRLWAIGLLAALAGQSVYSLMDAVAMGAKTNVFLWFLLALLIGLGMISSHCNFSRPDN